MVDRLKNDSQLHVPCVRCGKPAAPHGEHHAVEKGGGRTSGKGMGGSSYDHEHERIPLCRTDHNNVHGGKFRIERGEDDLIRAVSMTGRELSVRAVTEIDATELNVDRAMRDLLFATQFFSDQSLALIWDNTDEDAARALLRRCYVAHAMSRKYGSYGDKWAERAADIIKGEHGAPLAPQTVRKAARMMQALIALCEPPASYDPIFAIRNLGVVVLEAIARRDDPASAAQVAIEMRDDGAQMTDVAKALKPATEQKPPKCDDTLVHVCRHCGEEWEYTSDGE